MMSYSHPVMSQPTLQCHSQFCDVTEPLCDVTPAAWDVTACSVMSQFLSDVTVFEMMSDLYPMMSEPIL